MAERPADLRPHGGLLRGASVAVRCRKERHFARQQGLVWEGFGAETPVVEVLDVIYC